jgi:hypothetical protein
MRVWSWALYILLLILVCIISLYHLSGRLYSANEFNSWWFVIPQFWAATTFCNPLDISNLLCIQMHILIVKIICSEYTILCVLSNFGVVHSCFGFIGYFWDHLVPILSVINHHVALRWHTYPILVILILGTIVLINLSIRFLIVIVRIVLLWWGKLFISLSMFSWWNKSSW